MRRLAIFLLRKRLGVKKYESFRFLNQKSDAVYYFTESNILKRSNGRTSLSHVSVNWILDDECRIEIVTGD